MGCEEIRQQLAAYRELNMAEQDRVRQHLAGCADCTGTLAAYSAQDRVLAALPALTPSLALIAAVHAQTVGRHRAAQSFYWRRAMAALSLLLCVSIAWGTVSSASGALPGDLLYPIKRGTEQVRLAFMFNPSLRDQYQRDLAETRRQEVSAVVREGREVQVEFQGELAAIHDGVWQVNGLAVTVNAQAWSGALPPIGSVLAVEAQTTAGQLTASRVRVLEPTVPIPGPQQSVTPGAWGPGPEASVTPGAWGPGGQPSATPGARGPEVQTSATPGAWGPGGQPSATPGAWGPGPQPTHTTVPGPQPSHTSTPGQEPSRTTTPGPQASHTATPGLQPSHTRTPEPQPSHTRTPGLQPSRTMTPEPQPSHTMTPEPQPSRTMTPEPQPSHTSTSRPQVTVTAGPGGH